MIEWSIDAFEACGSVGAIVVAAPPGHADDLAGRPGLTVVPGGATRAQSVANALDRVETDLLAIHDAARPLLTPELVEALLALLDQAPEAAGVIAATPVTDTVKQARSTPFSIYSVEKGGLAIESTVDRSQLWAAQTPQVFRTEALRGALEVEAEVRDAATDEAMLVEAAGGTVLIHPTEQENLKVTTQLDLRAAELVLGARAGRGSA